MYAKALKSLWKGDFVITFNLSARDEDVFRTAFLHIQLGHGSRKQSLIHLQTVCSCMWEEGSSIRTGLMVQ